MFEEHTEIQFKSKAEIEAFQNERLQKAIEYVSKNSPYYKRLFAENNINVADIKTVADAFYDGHLIAGDCRKFRLPLKRNCRNIIKIFTAYLKKRLLTL